jgi:hypothetical protein
MPRSEGCRGDGIARVRNCSAIRAVRYASIAEAYTQGAMIKTASWFTRLPE